MILQIVILLCIIIDYVLQNETLMLGRTVISKNSLIDYDICNTNLIKLEVLRNSFFFGKRK